MPCEFCGDTSFSSHKAREMMFDFLDEFEYRECSSCGCLKIAAVPQNLEKYYPADSYYSYDVTVNLRVRARRLLLRVVLRNRWLDRATDGLMRFGTLGWARLYGLRRAMRILDVGSGGAAFIRDLRAGGFSHAMGLDPFIQQDIHDAYGLAVKKGNLQEAGAGWDRIMFHHSLEHIPDQIGTLQIAQEMLSSGGVCIVRIPVVNWAWKEYGTNWVQLDPPRHLCVHTEKSFRMAAAKAGLQVARVVYDSGEFQFLGSELYKKGIPLHTGTPELKKHFTARERHEFRRRAEELNRQGLGDQAAFFLERLG